MMSEPARLTAIEPIYWETRARQAEKDLEAAKRQLAMAQNALANNQRMTEALSERLEAAELAQAQASTQREGATS